MYKVLVVEDELNARVGLRDLLRKKGELYEVHTVKNGKEGLEAVESFMPDIIITDIRMPVLDGLSMILELRKREVHAEILLLTGYAEFKYAQTAVKLGVRDYILKPIDPDTIFAQLARCVENIEAGSESKDEALLPEHSFSMPVESTIRQIEKKFDTSISLSSVAEDIGITPQYLSRIFSKETGLKFCDYLIQFRITKAKELIQNNSHLKIYEVAKMVGYPDVKYFSTLFKKMTGTSPLSYRFMR